MAVSLIPDMVYESIYTIDVNRLKERGITLILADLDNTLACYGQAMPDEEMRKWAAQLKEKSITLFLLSNSRKPGRAKRFAEELGIPFIGHAGKPKSNSFHQAMKQMGCSPSETVMIGDQIFTDVLGAKNAGVWAVLIKPIRLAGNPGRYIRYWAETPFRAAGKRRNRI